MEKKIKKNKESITEKERNLQIRRLLSTGLPALFFICFFYFFQELAIMLGDDYFYGNFLGNGWEHMIAEHKSHYENINGRVLVHIVVSFVANFGTLIFPMTSLLFMLLLTYTYSLCTDKENIFPFFCGVTSFTIGLLLILDIRVLRESVLWISAYFNYIFPVSLFFLLIYLQKNEKHILLVTLASFCAAATTEQCGAMALTGFVLISLLSGFRKKISFFRLFFPLLAGVAGYATVIFSPGIINRLVVQTAEEPGKLLDQTVYYEVADALFGQIFGESGFGFHLIFCLALMVFYLYFVDKNKKCAIILSGMTAYFAFLFLPSLGESKFHQGTIMFVIFGSLFLYFVFTQNEMFAVVIAGAGVSIIVIIPTTFTEPRVLLPFYLLICLLSASVFTSLLAKLDEKFLPIGMISFFCVTIILSVNTCQGLLVNYKIEKQNLAVIEGGYETGEILFNMDYDMDYVHLLFLHNGFHYTAFTRYYDINDGIEFKVKSDIHPKVMVDDFMLGFPAIALSDDGVYFCLLDLVEAFGGYCLWSPEQTDLIIGENDYYLVHRTFYKSGTDEVVFEGNELINFDFYVILAHQSIIEELFGINVDYDESIHSYLLTLEN